MKPFVDHLHLARLIAGLEQQARTRGLSLRLRTDFGHLCRLCGDLPDKPSPTAMFNPLLAEIGADNGFWLEGVDRDGRVSHVQAVRRDELAGTTLAQELESLRAFYRDPSLVAAGEYCRSFAPAAREITGRVCYHGEMWLRGGPGGLRGKGLSAVLPKLALAIALARWAPDFVYGFGYPALINNGVMLQYGYCHMQPRVVYWVRPERSEPLDVWIVWLTGRDLVALCGPSQEGDVDVLRKVA